LFLNEKRVKLSGRPHQFWGINILKPFGQDVDLEAHTSSSEAPRAQAVVWLGCWQAFGVV